MVLFHLSVSLTEINSVL